MAVHLREEHDEFRPLVEESRATADRIVCESPSGLSDEVDRQIEKTKLFLRRQLLPHAEVEERALYPVVAKILGGANSTESMSHDHNFYRHAFQPHRARTQHDRRSRSHCSTAGWRAPAGTLRAPCPHCALSRKGGADLSATPRYPTKLRRERRASLVRRANGGGGLWWAERVSGRLHKTSVHRVTSSATPEPACDQQE